MQLDLFDNKGVMLDRQRLTWKDMVGKPISKLDDDAFSRVRVILLMGLERDALRLKHVAARFDGALRLLLAQISRVEQHQATLVNWLLPADQSPVETTIAHAQAAIEVTADVAQKEPDPYPAQTYRFGLLEDVDHLYRFAALLDRLEGKDANNILQGYTDIVPGRPAIDAHRAPVDDLRRPYGAQAALATKLHATLITAAAHQTHDYCMTIGPLFADPLARQLHAEIASIKVQHATQYGSLIDPGQSLLQQWLLHELTEVWAYASCLATESNARLKAVWERFLDYELGHFHHVAALIRDREHRDPFEGLSRTLPPLLALRSQRDFVSRVLRAEVRMCVRGGDYFTDGIDSPASLGYRQAVNADGSPSQTVAEGYQWSPGTELARSVAVAV